MTATQCACGFTELADEQIGDHLALVFTPDNLIGNDGKEHEELPGLACACGYVTSMPGELEGHLLEAFTPVSRIGLDGKRHAVGSPSWPFARYPDDLPAGPDHSPALSGKILLL
jgi:hypothetical protein